jgi:hypothetical protein
MRRKKFSGSANLRIARIPYTYTARMIPKIGATIMLAAPESRMPKKTKPTPGLCANGLPKLESAISASSIPKIVRVTPRDFSAIADDRLHQERSALRRDRMIAVASGTPIPNAVVRIEK